MRCATLYEQLAVNGQARAQRESLNLLTLPAQYAVTVAEWLAHPTAV